MSIKQSKILMKVNKYVQIYSKSRVFVCANVKAVGNVEKQPVQVEAVLLIIG